MKIELTVNGERREIDGAWGGESLLYALRERLGLPGSKNACEQGECGSCSVYLDGTLVCACLVLAAQAEGRDVVTVEGLAPDDRLHEIQQRQRTRRRGRPRRPFSPSAGSPTPAATGDPPPHLRRATA